MKFGDKLIKLRKGRGYSQEDLASMLNVSRQSVSKWESNNTYPETDKIVQICNIFDCSMDSLIDESVLDVEQNERKSKSNFNIIIDSLLGFITKTINMLSQMKFTSILKCIIEQVFIALVLFVISYILVRIVPYIICHIFIFLSSRAYNFIYSVLKGICEAVCLILSLIVIIHIFKIRYLNYYDKCINSTNAKNSDEKKDNSNNFDRKLNVEKEEKVIFRDPNHEPFAFLSVLSKIVIYVIKFCVCCILLFAALVLIFALIGLVISLYLSVHSVFFVGTSLSFIGGVLLIVLAILLLLYFVINKKVNIKVMTILFLTSLLLIGIGGGIGFIGVKNFKVLDANNINTREDIKKITYEDNMIITNAYPHKYSILIDNNMNDNDIIIKNNYIYKFQNISYNKTYLYGMKNYTFYSTFSGNYFSLFDLLLKDLENNVIRDYFNFNNSNRDMRIITNEKTALKLMDNFSKVYLYSQTKTIDGYVIYDIEDKIEEDDVACGGYYNASEDKVICPNWCSSEISREKTEMGIKIYYSCTSNN